jgi:hypothetical protein
MLPNKHKDISHHSSKLGMVLGMDQVMVLLEVMEHLLHRSGLLLETQPHLHHPHVQRMLDSGTILLW